MIYALGKDEPALPDRDYWVAPTAIVIGKVTLMRNSSVWWGCVLRGDGEPITLGEGSNIQENTVVHTDKGCPVVIGANVTVGHMACIHGCTIGDGSLIGIGAMVLSGAKIGKRCLIGAKALIPEGKEIPDNSLVMGIPGKIVGEVRQDQIERMIRSAEAYVGNWHRAMRELREVG